LFPTLPKNEGGFTHVFVAVDVYFKYCFLCPLKSLKTDEIANCAQDIIFLVGTPARILPETDVICCLSDASLGQGMVPGPDPDDYDALLESHFLL
jgi:hypothetical protein